MKKMTKTTFEGNRGSVTLTRTVTGFEGNIETKYGYRKAFQVERDASLSRLEAMAVTIEEKIDDELGMMDLLIDSMCGLLRG